MTRSRYCHGFMLREALGTSYWAICEGAEAFWAVMSTKETTEKPDALSSRIFTPDAGPVTYQAVCASSDYRSSLEQKVADDCAPSPLMIASMLFGSAARCFDTRRARPQSPASNGGHGRRRKPRHAKAEPHACYSPRRAARPRRRSACHCLPCTGFHPPSWS